MGREWEAKVEVGYLNVTLTYIGYNCVKMCFQGRFCQEWQVVGMQSGGGRTIEWGQRGKNNLH